ncbi:hypothetical protein LTR91_016867 [Friedmanniomyces endolithicus]|uniref:PXA domain-containing protein n=1 Tax=Friedmanniomyces endolithicus TaxID=329885 RepID=A0AAN6K7K7_9PEZI|nr:hypothetical protein LTR91_016867 [Friedmanniomyces endolithicus]
MDETKTEAATEAGKETCTSGEGRRDMEPVTPEVGKTTAAIQHASPSGILQSVTDRALHFLSHASNETLGACLVGLSATTYLVLGRVGLVIIGVAGGVVLHATWEGVRNGDRAGETEEAWQERRRGAGMDVARRVLAWRMSRPVDEQCDSVKVYAEQKMHFSGFGPETAAALTIFTDAIIKDYVHYWYDPTIPGDVSFPGSCNRTLISFLLSLSGHLRRKRPADALLDFVTNASSLTIVFLNELSAALNASPNANAEDALATYLEFKPDCSLSYMINEDSQKAKLADAAEDVLQAYLDPKAYNFPPAHVFLKEVLAQLILGYTVAYCSKPEFINEWIVYGLEESETTKEVMDIVDAGVQGRTRKDEVAAVQPVAAEVRVVPEQNSEGKEDAAKVVAPIRPRLEHRRQTSKAEEAMDEAMREARRLTQLMIEDDNRQAREEQEKQSALSSSEDVSDATTHGAATPTSSQSDKERQEDEAAAWGTESNTAAESPMTTTSRPMTPTSKQQFTSFDQILPPQQLSAFSDSPERSRRGEPAQLTLHNATISIFHDSEPNERTSIKTKPQSEYLIQIEPQSSSFPGWMIARRYTDFEMLHEVLRRISVITGVQGFAASHAELPRWRTNTKPALRGELERYLTDAVRFQPLAESEGMKRFLEKDQGLAKSPGEKNKGFGWPTPDAFGKFGGDMMNVLTKAPKQVAGGGKVVFGGVAGLVGGKRPASMSQSGSSRGTAKETKEGGQGHRSMQSVGQFPPREDSMGSLSAARQSMESVRSVQQANLERHAGSTELRPRPSVSSSRLSNDLARSTESLPAQSDGSQDLPRPQPQPVSGLDSGLEAAISLPPPPSEITDDFGLPKHAAKRSSDTSRPSSLEQARAPADHAALVTPTGPSEVPADASSATTGASSHKFESKPKQPLTEREASVAVELMFAVITELYTLSSAWQIRRTLLAAAKTFLLRPGNPQLEAIRAMLQTTLLDSHLSDAGVAAQVYKLRENGLPTSEELEVWARDYPVKTAEEKEALRVKARNLLVTKGMPQALTSVMGAAASGEALGKVFDCLQVEGVARGTSTLTKALELAVQRRSRSSSTYYRPIDRAHRRPNFAKMPRNLTINPAAPYKSSRLAAPSSPFSPRLPLTPPSTTVKARSSSLSPKSSRKPAVELPSPPSDPLRWLWQCHLCGRVYQLGTTRRCLDDGHYFCAGTTTVKRSRRTNKKTVRHKACCSEFDYQGWKTWGVWRRSIAEMREVASSDENEDVVLPLQVPTVPREGEWLNGTWAKTSVTKGTKKPSALRKNCSMRCDYPSECRWGKQYGVHTPVTSTPPPLPPVAPVVPEKSEKPKTTFDDILLDASDASQSTAADHSPEIATSEAATINSKETEKKPSMTDLLESAKRRKRRSGGQMPSPLGSNPPSPTTAEAPKEPATSDEAGEGPSAGFLQKAFDDFELELRKSSLLERAGGLVSGWASSIRSSAALEEEKAELFVKGLKLSKKK